MVYCLSDGNFAVRPERYWRVGHMVADHVAFGRLGVRQIQDAGVGHFDHLRAVPVHLPERRLGGTAGEDLQHSILAKGIFG